MGLDDFTQHYLIAALWTGEFDNRDVYDIAPEAIATAIEDCTKFQKENASKLENAYLLYEPHPDAPTAACSAGHDFWLTRNGHGAGFWDRGLGELGEALTKAAHEFGELDLYLWDDNFLHFSGE